MYTLKANATFDSAHFLHGYQGKCANIHGHHWMVEALIGSKELQQEGEKRGMVIDFGDFKKILRSLADELDHALIYEENTLKSSTEQALKEEGFRILPVPFRPTAENFSTYFAKKLMEKNLPVKCIWVWETPDNCAIYEPEESNE